MKHGTFSKLQKREAESIPSYGKKAVYPGHAIVDHCKTGFVKIFAAILVCAATATA
jgi:hypothetical protein